MSKKTERDPEIPLPVVLALNAEIDRRAAAMVADDAVPFPWEDDAMQTAERGDR